MALVRVYYAESMTEEQFEKALTCRRCEGHGHERADVLVECPNCGGTGDDFDNGWTYVVPDDWELAIGDRIVVPPTPKSKTAQIVTIIGLGSKFKMQSKLKRAVKRA